MSAFTPQVPVLRRLAVPLLLAWSQLAAAAVGLGCAVVHASRVPELHRLFGRWDRVPVPLVVAVAGAVTLVLVRRGRPGGAMTAAAVPFAVHVLAVLEDLPEPAWATEGTGAWLRDELTRPLGQPVPRPSAALVEAGDWACLAAVVLGVVTTIGIGLAARREDRWSPPVGREPLMAATAVLALAAGRAGERLALFPEIAPPPRPALVVLAAAVAAALADAHTRRAAREGSPVVAAVSAGVSGVILMVPLGWREEPLVARWLRARGERHLVIGIGRGVGALPDQWNAVGEGLLALSRTLVLVAAGWAAVTGGRRVVLAVRWLRRAVAAP